MEKLSKIELIKECQRLMIKNDYSLISAKIIGDFMKENLETNDEWYQNHKDEIPKIWETGLSKDTSDKLSSLLGTREKKE